MLGQGLFVSWNRFVSAIPCDGGVAPYLVKQGFEGSPYDHCETWILSGAGSAGTDPNYVVSPLAGLKSLQVISNTINQDANCPAFSAIDEAWSYFLFRVDVMPVVFAKQVAVWQFGAGTSHGALSVNTNGTLQVASSSISATVDALSVGVVYNVWFHFKSGTGANGVIDVGFSTTGIRPVAGDKFVQLTGQTNPQDITHFSFMRYDGNPGNGDYVFDNARIDDAVIGDNPP